MPCEYVKPVSSGVFLFADGTFDLITCLGTLHHIANVTFVVSEMWRVLATGGHVLGREPMTSMGDWRRPRPDATKRERRIPLGYMDALVQRARFSVVRRSLCVFPPLTRICGMLGIHAFRHKVLVELDRLACWSCAARGGVYQVDAVSVGLRLVARKSRHGGHGRQPRD